VPDGRVDGEITGPGRPYGAPAADVLGEAGYVCEELVLAGTAVAYTHADETPTSDGRWAAEPYGEGAFRTRLLVLRPTDPTRFNGTVLLHWQNVSAGYEQPAPAGGETYRGYAWVGVSAQEVGLYGLPMGRHGPSGGLALLDADPERYGQLRHPGEQGCFEIFSAAAEAVRGGEVLGDLAVDRIVALGGSQSAMRLCAYANGIHQRHRVVDAYLLSVWEGRAPRLDDGTMSMYRRTTIRVDLDVPLLVVNSEFEIPATADLELDDHDGRRVWEVAGTAHGAPRRPRTGRGDWAPNPVSWQPVHEAALRAVHRWLVDGAAPAIQPRIALDEGPTPTVLRGDDGNAVGGIRLPEIAVPVAEHRGHKLGTGSLPLFGGRRPFPDDVVRTRYRSRQDYLARWMAAVDALVEAGTVLPEDAITMRERGVVVAEALPLD
jgi:hypothetical protein